MTNIFDAVQSNDLEQLKAFLKNHNIDQVDKNGRTALIYASKKGHIEIAKLLIENRAKLDITDNKGCSALFYAVYYDYEAIVKSLLDYDAGLDKPNEYGVTPLMTAAAKGQKEIAELLITKGATIDLADEDGLSALILAIRQGQIEIAKLLITKGATVDLADKEGCSALFYAAKQGHIKFAELLIERGANINATNKKRQTPLLIAALEGNKEFVKFLIEKDAILPSKSGIKKNIVDALKSAKQARDEKTKKLQQERIESTANNIVNTFNQKFEILNSQQYTGQDRSKDTFIFDARNQAIRIRIDCAKIKDLIISIFEDQKAKKFFKTTPNPDSSLTIGLNAANLIDDASCKECLELIYQLIVEKKLDSKLEEERNRIQKEKEQQEEETTKKEAVGTIEKEITNLESRLREEKEKLANEELKRDLVIESNRDFKKSDQIVRLQKAIDEKEEEMQKKLQELINLLKAQIEKGESDDKNKEKNEKIKATEKKLFTRFNDNIDELLTKLSNQKKKLEEVKIPKDDKKKDQLEKIIKDLSNRVKTNLEESNRPISSCTEWQNKVAGLRRMMVHLMTEIKISETKEAQQKEEESKQKGEEPESEFVGNMPANSCLLETCQDDPVPQEAEQELRLSDIDCYRDTLYGVNQFNYRQLVTINSSDSQVAAAGAINPLLDIRSSSVVHNTRKVIEAKQVQELTEDKKIRAQEREERKNFHKLFDQVINQVRLNSDLDGIESHGNDANLRSLIYTFLCYCAGDQNSVARSYQKLEIKGGNVGDYTGLGHASGNSVKNLQALQDILKQFIPAEDNSEKKLFENVTLKDLNEALRNSYQNAYVVPPKKELVISEITEVPKDAHSYIKDIFKELFIQDAEENKFTHELKENFIDFVHRHAILKDIKDLISTEDIIGKIKEQYENDNFELLDKVIDSSLDKQNVESEVAGALETKSFDDFKEMMVKTYSKYEKTIKAELSKKQGQIPPNVLAVKTTTRSDRQYYFRS